VAERITRATEAGKPVLLTGRTMGGGPGAWAARDHAQVGLPCFATPDAARTLDDDLAGGEAQGIRVVEEDEALRLLATQGDRLVHIEMRDFDAAALRTALGAFGVDTDVDLVAVAAFDHGAAPPGYSDRRFRFDSIARAVREDRRPLAFACRAVELPVGLTRLRAVVADAAAYFGGEDMADALARVVVMDTGAAAVAGALEDQTVRSHNECLIANVGNFHTLAFHLRSGRIVSLFEHHTGELDRARLESYLLELADGTLDNERIFAASGHGALPLAPTSPTLDRPSHGRRPFLAVTGPRRELLRGSTLHPYEAVPHGDMMLAGCFGLLRGVAVSEPRYAAPIEK